jgi:hypothetical protein
MVQFLADIRDFLLLYSIQTGSVADPVSYPIGSGVLFPRD